jgi:hypothetical protein
VTVELRTAGQVLFRSTAAGSNGRLAAVPVAAPAGPRTVSALSCNRFFAAHGVGLCLRPDGPLTTYQLAQLSATLAVTREIPLVGVPNRARVSPSGRMLSWTVFVRGDDYDGDVFSTRAGILDTGTTELKDLSDFAVTLDGHAYQAADASFWGVTFASDDRHFYATMSTGHHRYLVAGDFAAGTLRTIASNVECPSLAPDGRRLVFKEAIGADPARGWRLSVLDLATLARTPLAETRSVDDQATWLDDHTVLYGLSRGQGSDVWAVAADGTGRPRLFIPDAASPAVL